MREDPEAFKQAGKSAPKPHTNFVVNSALSEILNDLSVAHPLAMVSDPSHFQGARRGFASCMCVWQKQQFNCYVIARHYR